MPIVETQSAAVALMPILKTQSVAVVVGGVFTSNICEAKLLNLITLGYGPVLPGLFILKE
jgi:hypothetical protein